MSYKVNECYKEEMRHWWLINYSSSSQGQNNAVPPYKGLHSFSPVKQWNIDQEESWSGRVYYVGLWLIAMKPEKWWRAGMALGNIYDAVHPLDVPRPHILQMNMSQCIWDFWKGPLSVGPGLVSRGPLFCLVSGRAEPRCLSSGELEESSLSHVNHEVNHLPFSAILSSSFILFLLLLLLTDLPKLPSTSSLRLPSTLSWHHRHSQVDFSGTWSPGCS